MFSYNFSSEAKESMHIAQSLAKENLSPTYRAEHLLKSVLRNEFGVSSQLVSYGKDVNYLKDWVEYRIETLPKAPTPVSEPPADTTLSKVFEVGDLNRLKLGKELLDPMCLLLAMIKPEVAFSTDQLKTLSISESELLSTLVGDQPVASSDGSTAMKSSANGEVATQSVLDKFCNDKTKEAKENISDQIIGREGEIRKLKEIICRRTKPNVILVGEPGVGKTSLVDGFAHDIINDNVPEYLKGFSVLELDLGTLIAGAAYKGEIEDRLKKIIAEIKIEENVILFIDEIHALLDAKSGFGGAANLLKPELARGEITVIGATTNEEYQKFIESDEAFNRRFDKIIVEEPDEIVANKMLEKVVPNYEEHHEINMEDGSIPETVSLCKRYLKDRRLPDSAIDLIDQTMSAIRLMYATTDTEISTFKKEISELTSEDHADYAWVARNIKEKISPILINKLEEELTVTDAIPVGEVKKSLKDYLGKVDKLFKDSEKVVSKADISAMVSQRTGIPMGKLQKDEKQKLLELESILNKRVVGQDHTLKIIAEAVRESRAGLLKAGQPIASFFFMGPTGTGKTELAKALAEFLFNEESALMRFDMSEFKEEHSVALLYGAPPGYVGYEEGGLLVNKIRQKPYSVVLFDEIEKAHHSVFDLFLQILDEGKLSDRLGKEGDFSNAIILFTSNIGSEFIIEQFNSGAIPDTSKLMERMSMHFRPEFLARLTELVPFSPIQESVLVMIFNIQLKKLIRILDEKGIELNVSAAAVQKLATEGFDQRYGARPLKGKIRQFIRRPIARMIIAGEVKEGQKVDLGLDNNNELQWNIS